jgi:hypothetical protein
VAVVAAVAVGVATAELVVVLAVEPALELVLCAEPPQAASSRDEIRGAIARRQRIAPA